MTRNRENPEFSVFQYKERGTITPEQIEQLRQYEETRKAELRRLISVTAKTLPHELIRPLPVPQYRQRDGKACFFASLIAAKMALSGQNYPHNELALTAQARQRKLMDDRGALTDVQHMDDQTAFIREQLGLNVRFINDSQEAAFACTEHVSRGKPSLFGLPGHWVLLDAIDNRKGNPEQMQWEAMDPIRDTPRQISLDTIIERLGATRRNGWMPIVVVEGLVEGNPLFRARTSTSDSGFKPKFRRG